MQNLWQEAQTLQGFQNGAVPRCSVMSDDNTHACTQTRTRTLWYTGLFCRQRHAFLLNPMGKAHFFSLLLVKSLFGPIGC